MKKNIVFYILFALLPFAVQAGTIEAKYDVDIGVFDAAKLDVSYKIEPKAYQLKATVLTDGIFDTFYPFRAEYRASGRFASGRAVSAEYRYRAKSRSHVRTKRLVFDEHGNLTARESSKDHQKKSVAVSDLNPAADAHDLLTIFALLNRQIGSQKTCEANLLVDDGKKQYVVTTQDDGEETLEGKPLKRCSLLIAEINTDDDDDLWQTTAERPMLFWLETEPKTGMPYIVQIQVASTPLGHVVARLEHLDVKDE